MMGSGFSGMMAARMTSMWVLLAIGGLIGIATLVVLFMMITTLRSMRHPTS